MMELEIQKETIAADAHLPERKITAIRDNSNWYQKYRDSHLKFERFKHQSWNIRRHNDSLKVFGNSHLRKDNLIDRACHKKHTDKLYARFQRKIDRILKVERARIRKVNKMGISKFATDGFSIINRRVRFLTVVYSVEALDDQAALKAATRLTKLLTDAIKRIKGASCLGAIEVEVISVRNMRRLRDLSAIVNFDKTATLDEFIDPTQIKTIQTADDVDVPPTIKEHRKLDVCEALGSHLGEEILGGESGQLLVHFHGLITVKKESDLDDLLSVLNENPQLTKKPRQIRFQKFRRSYCGTPCSINSSLYNFARYFTKGGNDFINGKSYLQYKLKFPKDTSLTYEEQLIEWDRMDHHDLEIEHDSGTSGFRSNSTVEFIDDKNTINFLTLSILEVNVLTKVIDGMMSLNTTRTGYLVTVGRW